MPRRTSTKTTRPSVRALWSLFWRAILLTPVAILFGVLWVIGWALLCILPICEILLLFNGSWLQAAITPVVWLLLFLLVRSSWFKAERCDFPNDQENV